MSGVLTSNKSVKSQNNYKATESNWNDEEKESLKQNMKKLSEKLIGRFGKVSVAFRAFDVRLKGKVSFSDFAYVIDQLKLGFNRNTILQVFTYMDYDKDSMLKYQDFCTLCANSAPEQSSLPLSSKGLEVLLAQRYETADTHDTKGQETESSQNKSISLNDKFTRVMRQLRQKNSGLTGKKPRGISVGCKINTGLRKGVEPPRDNFEATKKMDQIRGDQEFVSTELQRFVENKADLVPGHQIHSPLHNRFDSVRESEVYNSIGSSSGWRSILQSGKMARIKNQWPGSKPCGLTSEELSFANDPTAKQNGGQMGPCISHNYERDFILEAMLKDKMRQDSKAAQKRFDLRKTTKTNEARIRAAKDKLKSMNDREKSAGSLKHKPGSVPQYYPMVKVNKLLNGKELAALNVDQRSETKFKTVADDKQGVLSEL